MERRVVITGLGVLSPFGRGVDLFWDSLCSGKSALGEISHFDVSGYRSGVGAEVPQNHYADLRSGNAEDGLPVEDAAYFLSIAATDALQDAKAGPDFDDTDRVGCVLGSLCGGTRNLMRFSDCYRENVDLPAEDPALAVLISYQLNYLTARHNLTGPSTIVSTACASTTDAVGYAFELMRRGDCDRALVGGGDILAEPVHGGFNAFQNITTSTPRPFDTQRDGFMIGEGAGAFYMETLESAHERGARVYAEVVGYGLSNTAYHLTATTLDGQGEALSITRALDDAGIAADAVGYINTHGTATRHNDSTEIKAINQVFGRSAAENVIANSIKPAIGHCMGAAGIMEALTTVMALDRQEVPPTLNTSADESELEMHVVRNEKTDASIDHAISQSFGFGGACSCLVLARGGM